jgi:hypothetical protein
VMAGIGVRFRPADNNRILGWSQVRQRLRGMDGAPMMRVFSTCIDTIRTVPLLQHDTIRPEDVDSEGEDHAADDIRYACLSRPWATVEKPKPAVRDINSLTMDDVWKKCGTPQKTRRI